VFDNLSFVSSCPDVINAVYLPRFTQTEQHVTVNS
jgi:hypothetical protein